MSKRRVVITGMGCVSCVGNDVASTWDSVVNGRCGLGRVTLFDATDFKTLIGGEVKNLRAEDYIPAKELKRVDDFCLYAIAAFVEAVRSAGLPEDFRSEGCPVDPDRVGVIGARIDRGHEEDRAARDRAVNGLGERGRCLHRGLPVSHVGTDVPWRAQANG